MFLALAKLLDRFSFTEWLKVVQCHNLTVFNEENSISKSVREGDITLFIRERNMVKAVETCGIYYGVTLHIEVRKTEK